MRKITLIIGLFIALQTNAQSNPLNGPNDCLVQTPGSCPVDFLKNAICYRDPSVCRFFSFSNSFRFYDILFLSRYGNTVFPELNNIEAAQLLSSDS